MASFFRWFRVFILTVLLTSLVLAQSPQLGGFVDQLEGLVSRRDINGAARLVESQPQVAQEAFVFMAYTLNTMDPDVQQQAVLMLNVIARTFKLRGNSEMYQLLSQNGKALADNVWQGTVLSGIQTAASTPVANNTGASNPEAIALVCIRVGNFADAESMLRQLLATHPGPVAERRIKRQIAACSLGQGRPHEALRQVEELLKTPADSHEKLASELLASHCAYRTALRARLNDHIQKARALATIEPGPYGQVARYLLESHQLSFDLLSNPDLSVDEIMRRHASCWKEIQSLKPASQEELALFTSELWWVMDVFENTWLWSVGRAKVRPGEQADPRLKEIGPNVTVLFDLGKQLSAQGHSEVTFSSLEFLQNIVDAYLQDADLKNSQPLLTRLDTSLPGLYQGCQQLQKVVGSAPISTTRGSISRLMARHFQLKALQSVKGAQANFSEDVRRSVEEDLSRADSFAEQADNIDTHLQILRTRLEYLHSARPTNWQQTALQSISQYSQLAGATAGRFAQFTVYNERGKIYLAQGKKNEAAADFQKAIDTLEADLRDSGSSASRSQSIRSAYSQLYEDLAKAQAQEGKSAAAFETLDRLQQMQSFGRFKLQDLQKRVRGGDQATLNRAGEAQAQIQAAELELVALKNSRASQGQIDKAVQILADNRSAYYACVNDLEQKYPEFRKLDIKPINFSKLQRSIPANTLVVQYFASKDELFILQASRENVMVRKVPVARAELERLVTDFRRLILNFPASGGRFSWSSPDGENLKKTSTQLYAHLIAPLEGDLAGKEALAVVPFDFLLYLPFQALASEAGGKLQYLVEKKQVVVLCKAADLDQVFGAPASKTGSLVAFGNPDGSLPGSGEEAQALKEIFPGSKVFLSGDATIERLKGIQAPAVAYLHFATHGILDDDPRQSHLVMARGNKLAVTDIVGFQLDGPDSDLNLATLSACETALGGPNHDGSDLRSLASAFSLAGCRSVVASLWSVEDESTRNLMVEFYKGLKAGKTKAQALQLAQCRQLAQEKYNHPFFWAPFILIGDWR
ncbi:CHAT domain-containing protein [bacterium]|nr:CHAT domain-containing protein [bacterium]